MNNKYLASLLCITVLALAPACTRKKQTASKEHVNKMIELDNSVFEVENVVDEEHVVKF